VDATLAGSRCAAPPTARRCCGRRRSGAGATTASATQEANGLVRFREYQFLKRWFAGARYERSDHADDASLQDRGIAAVVTFWPSEFSQLRTEARRRSYANGETADEILFQVQFAIGAHGAHPF
jgi:hypothetical protein